MSSREQGFPFAARTQKKPKPAVGKPGAAQKLQASPTALIQRAQLDPGTLTPGDVLQLQRAIGNRAVANLLQRKALIGPANDRHEQEADRIAAHVMAMPAAPVAPTIAIAQRAGDEDELQATPLAQRAGAGFDAGPAFETQLSAARGGGAPMATATRAFMEQRIGADFSEVKVHTDAQSHQLNQSIQAKAFTTGQNVFFRQGAYEPASQDGRELIAHELTHVVQQNGEAVMRTHQGQTAESTIAATRSASTGEGALQAKSNGSANDTNGPGAQRPNQTGLPDHLKAGVESLSGMSLDNVNVHYNSAQSTQLNALAYTQGSDIHVAQGQERHLPHEAWHVVQQAQGRVKPTVQVKDSLNANDDAGLEAEADTMGAKAMSSPVQRKEIAKSDIRMKSLARPLQFKNPTSQATPQLYDHDPKAHPEYGLYHGLMASLGFPVNVIDQTWSLLLQGFREQDFIQHQLEQLEYGEDVVLSAEMRSIIRNDNIYFQEVVTLVADHLSVGNTPLALWSGGFSLSPYARQRGYTPLEETPLGMVLDQVEFHRDWVLQAPLWNILSTVFVRQQVPSVHVFLRTYEADAVLFRQEIPAIREVFPDMPIYWHAIYTLEDGTMLEINNKLALQDAWQGFASEDQCVQSLLEFNLAHPNGATERGLGTILDNLPPHASDAM